MLEVLSDWLSAVSGFGLHLQHHRGDIEASALLDGKGTTWEQIRFRFRWLESKGMSITDNLTKCGWKWAGKYTVRLIKQMGSTQGDGKGRKALTAGQEGVAGSEMTGELIWWHGKIQSRQQNEC